MKKISGVLMKIGVGWAILALFCVACILLVPTSRENPRPVTVEATNIRAEPQATSTEEAESSILTIEEMAYAEFVQEKLGEIAFWAFETAELFGKVGENPSLIFDEDWIGYFATVLFMFESHSEALAKYENVPDRFVKAHEWLIMASSEVKLAVSNWIVGIDNIDAEKIDAGNIHLTNANEYLEEFSKEFLKVMPIVD